MEERTKALLQANEQLIKEVEQRQDTEKALHMSEINFRNMIYSNADGILILDENSIVKFMNPAAESIFGTKATHFVGQTFEHLIIPEKPTELESGAAPVTRPCSACTSTCVSATGASSAML